MTSPSSSPARGRSLVRRYAGLLWGVTLSLLLLSGMTEMVFGYRESRAAIRALQAALAEGAAREVSLYLDTIVRSVRDVAKLPWNHPDYGPAQRQEEFQRLMHLEPAITELQAFDAQGREQVLVSKREAVRLASLQPLDEPGLLTVSPEAPVRYGMTRHAADLTPLVRIALFDGAGATVATVDLRHLGDIVTRLRVGADGQAYIVDGQDLLIAHPRATDVLRQLSLHDFAPVQRARAGAWSAGALQIDDAIDLQGRPVLATGARVEGPGWLIFVEQPRATALQPVLATLMRTLALMGVGGLAALAIGLWFARRMASPIVALRRATERIAAGDLSSLIQAPASEDEIQALARDFNRMTERLQESHAQLEAKVTERTAQLSEARDVLAARAEELTRLKDEAERANAAKTRFLAAASHDLRQPMHSISLLVGVLRTRLTEPAQLDLADKVQSSVTTMENLFGNLLDISKLDAGAVHAHIEDVDLGWLLERAAQTWAPQAQEKGLSLRVRPGRWVVRGDATLLERIVGNLLANAIRYTRHGGVVVGCRRRGTTCELQVWDTGPGIAAEHQEAIFEEFFRIGTPGAGQEKGLGLGLSIVRRCVHLQGYSIGVASREGRGSVFSVTMPLATGRMAGRDTSPAAQAPLQSLEGNFIVVVDDEATNREAVRDALLAAGCHVVIAASADEALAELQGHLRSPDLILTDYQLGSSGDGLAVIQQLRTLYDEPIPALVVTANTDTRLPAQAAALGAGLLHKPVGLQRLLVALKECLEARA